jgi:propionyl-CoA synthetase
MAFRELYRRSIDDPDGFWGEQASLVDWTTEPATVLDRADPRFPQFPRWYAGGELNTCDNAVDRHARTGRGAQPAIIHDSPVTGTVTTLTYDELLDRVARFAGVLRGLGVGRGDRVLVYMPMIPETVVAMLACARLGAVHCVVFGGFAAPELASRIDDAEPRVIVAASCGIEPSRLVAYGPVLADALSRVEHRPAHLVMLQRSQLTCGSVTAADVDWDEAMATAEPADCVPVGAGDPLYVLYTSGTTGRPKGVVRDNGGHAVALAWSMRNVYGVEPGEVWWAASDVGWVVGHSYIVYAPLLLGATTVLYEGKPVGTPDAGAFWRVVADHGVTGLFTAPTAIRAIKRDDPDGKLLAEHDTSSLRTLFLAGERLDPDTYHWATQRLGVPVVDNWWQTETGWPICANPRGRSGLSGVADDLPIKAGSPSVPMPGYDVCVLDEGGHELGAGAEGAIALRLPLPPGTLSTLWRGDDRYVEDYLSTYPGFYSSGDGGYVDDDGYVYVMGRTDDVINVAGHRLSTGSIEAVLASHPAVAECAVIGVHDVLKGQVARGLVVLKAGVATPGDQVCRELVALVREQIGPVAAFNQVDVVAGLPKTRSGKILRKAMRGLADGRDEPLPATIEDPAVFDTLRPLLRPPASPA